MGWALRRADLADLDAIMALETTTFGTDAWSVDAMRGDLGSVHTFYLVAERDDETKAVEGYAGLLAPAGADEGDIQTIAVVESARRGGLGRALMNALIGEARKRGARELFLEVRADNPSARTLYQSLGFEEIATRPKYYQPDGVDAVVMKLRIPDAVTRPAVGA